MHDAASVLFVNEAFYDAFRARDISTMDAIWSRRQEVACIHPGWPPLAGRDEVLRSWQGILGGSASPEILCREPKAFVSGDMAFVICYEQIGCNAVSAEDELDDEPAD